MIEPEVAVWRNYNIKRAFGAVATEFSCATLCKLPGCRGFSTSPSLAYTQRRVSGSTDLRSRDAQAVCLMLWSLAKFLHKSKGSLCRPSGFVGCRFKVMKLGLNDFVSIMHHGLARIALEGDDLPWDTESKSQIERSQGKCHLSVNLFTGEAVPY